MSSYAECILPQFDRGVLDIDGIALLLAALNERSIYVFGGSHDLSTFLRLNASRNEMRFQFIVRDYEPHFVAGDLYMVCKPNNGNIELFVNCFILDSLPDRINKGGKWVQLITAALSPAHIKVYTNSESLQHDEYSCKLFAINAARRLAKRSSYEVYGYFERVTTGISTPLAVLEEHTLPEYMMRDTQSLKQLRLYVSKNSPRALQKYIDNHIQRITLPCGEVKDQNRSIAMKLVKYRNRVHNYITKKNRTTIYSEICERLAFGFLPERMLEGQDASSFFFPNYHFIESIEAPFAQTNILIYKAREDTAAVLPSWFHYYQQLKTNYSPLHYILPLEPGSLLTDGILLSRSVALMEFVRMVEKDCISSITSGLSQPLAFLATFRVSPVK